MTECDKFSRSLLFVFSFLFVALCSSRALAQNPIEDAIKQLSSDVAKGYVQPLADGFGANLNSGFFRTAEIEEMGLHIELRFVGMATLIGDTEKKYTVTPPAPFSQQPVETATIFGDQGAVISGPNGLSYQFQNGQVKASLIPFAVPQLTIGNIYGTQASIRFLTTKSLHRLWPETLEDLVFQPTATS